MEALDLAFDVGFGDRTPKKNTSHAFISKSDSPKGDPALLEHRSQSRLVELGVVARSREAAHIDGRADAGFADSRCEFFHRASAVSDRPNDHRAKMPGRVPRPPRTSDRVLAPHAASPTSARSQHI